MKNQNSKVDQDAAQAALKEVHQKIKDEPNSALPDDSQPSAEEAAEQLKGSDADIDRNIGFDDQPSVEETKEQEKGTG